MAKKKTTPEPQAAGHVLDKDRIDADLSALLGRKVEGSTNQNGTDYRYGYARVSIPNLRGGDRRVLGAEGCKEADKVRIRLDLPDDAQDPHGLLVAWIADILRTGRTVRCGAGVGLRDWRHKYAIRGQSINVGLDSLIKSIDAAVYGVMPEEWEELAGRQLDLCPDYQRGYVWTDKQASRFVGHWLEGGETPRILVQRYESEKNVPPGVEWWTLPAEVIDGQQRLRSIYRWVKGEIKAEISDGRRWAYRDTNEIDRFGLDVVLTYVDMPRAERLAFYVRLNRGGTVHTEEEIQRVREMLAKEMG